MRFSMPKPEEFRKGCEEYEKHEKRDAMYKIATFLISKFWGKPSDMADALGVLLLTWNQSFYRYGYFDFELLEKCITENLQKLENYKNRDISSFSYTDERDIKKLFNDLNEALRIDTIRFSDKNRNKYNLESLKEVCKEFGVDFSGTTLKELHNSMKCSKMENAVSLVEVNKKSSIEITITELHLEEKQKLFSLDSRMKLIKRSPVSVAKTLHLLAPKFFPLWDDKIARSYGCYYDEKPADKYIEFCRITKIMAEKLKDHKIRSDRTIIKLIDEYNFSKYTKKWI